MFKMGCMARKILAPGSSSNENSDEAEGAGATSAGGKKNKKDKSSPAASVPPQSPPMGPKSTDELGDFSKLEDDPRLPLNKRQIFKITKSWKAIARTMSKTGTAMFLNLFEQNRDLLYLFDRFQHLKGRQELHESMELREHAATVMSTLDQSINSLSDYDNFVTYLYSIGQLHRKVPGFKRDFFWKIEQPFMKAVKQTLDERCNETIEEIYKIAIKLIIKTIADGYGFDAVESAGSAAEAAGGGSGGNGSGNGDGTGGGSGAHGPRDGDGDDARTQNGAQNQGGQAEGSEKQNATNNNNDNNKSDSFRGGEIKSASRAATERLESGAGGGSQLDDMDEQWRLRAEDSRGEAGERFLAGESSGANGSNSSSDGNEIEKVRARQLRDDDTLSSLALSSRIAAPQAAPAAPSRRETCPNRAAPTRRPAKDSNNNNVGWADREHILVERQAGLLLEKLHQTVAKVAEARASSPSSRQDNLERGGDYQTASAAERHKRRRPQQQLALVLSLLFALHKSSEEHSTRARAHHECDLPPTIPNDQLSSGPGASAVAVASTTAAVSA